MNKVIVRIALRQVCHAALLFTGVEIVFADALQVVNAQSAKIYYNDSEPVRGVVALASESEQPQTLHVEAWLEAGLDRRTEVQNRDVIVKAGGRASAEFQWPAAPLGMYGYAFRWRLLQEETALKEGVDYFTVCDDFWNVALMASHPTAYTAQSSKGQIAAALRRLREKHFNGFEKFFWAPDDFADMTPDKDVYYSGQVRYYESTSNIIFMVAEGHRLGMRAITYGKSMGSGTAGAEFVRAHPEWVHLGGGRLAMQAKIRALHYWDAAKDWNGNDGWKWQQTNWIFYNLNRRDVLDHGIGEIMRSARMFGWDGIRFDGHFKAASSWTDLAGETTRLTPVECDARTADNIRRMKERIRADFPRFVFGYNYLSGQSASELAGGSREFVELCRGGGHLMNEYIGRAAGINHPQHRWEDFATVMADDTQTVRRFGGHHFPILGYRGVDLWYAVAVAYASGAHPHFHHVWGAFATRHASLIWDRKLERINNPVGPIVAPLNLWWQRFVHRRRLDDTRQQVIVHLINPPIRPVVRNDAKEDHFPAPVKDVKVEVYPEGLTDGPWDLVRARLLDPDEVSVVDAEMRSLQGVAIVTVPELRVWKVLVLDFVKK